MYENKVNTNFQGKEVPNENISYDCLSLITLDSVIRVNKRYYPQTLLEECKYKIRKNKRDNHINDDFELDTDSESYNELFLMNLIYLIMNVFNSVWSECCYILLHL